MAQLMQQTVRGRGAEGPGGRGIEPQSPIPKPETRNPDPLAPLAPTYPALSGQTTECPRCRGMLAVINCEPVEMLHLGRHEMERLARCEHCTIWLRWFQACDADRGRAYGQPTTVMTLVDQTDEVDWLDNLFGHLIGVIQR